MPDLIILEGEKRIISKCGPSCYNSAFKECSCICRGINHGIGFKQALKNVLQPSFFLDKRFQSLKLSSHIHDYVRELTQLKLFQ